MISTRILNDLQDLVRNKLKSCDIPLVYKLSLLSEEEIDAILQDQKPMIDDDKAINVLQSIELIVEKDSIKHLEDTLKFIEDLYSDPQFKFDANEDGELDEKDIEQLLELKRELTADIHNKILILKDRKCDLCKK